MITLPTPYDWRERAQATFMRTGKHAMVGGYCCPDRVAEIPCGHTEGVQTDEILAAHGLLAVRSFFAHEIDRANLDDQVVTKQVQIT